VGESSQGQLLALINQAKFSRLLPQETRVEIGTCPQTSNNEAGILKIGLAKNARDFEVNLSLGD